MVKREGVRGGINTDTRSLYLLLRLNRIFEVSLCYSRAIKVFRNSDVLKQEHNKLLRRKPRLSRFGVRKCRRMTAAVLLLLVVAPSIRYSSHTLYSQEPERFYELIVETRHQHEPGRLNWQSFNTANPLLDMTIHNLTTLAIKGTNPIGKWPEKSQRCFCISAIKKQDGVDHKINGVEIFVYSYLLQTKSSLCGLILFVDNNTKMIQAILQSAHAADPLLWHTRLQLVPTNFGSNFYVSCGRWVLYAAFLSELVAERAIPLPRKVITADVRDTLFQKDPFLLVVEEDSGSQLWAIEENVQIKDCQYNSNWIRNCCGEDTLQELGNNTIICSGAALGSLDGFYALATKMADFMIRGKEIDRTSHGSDQGIFQYLLLTKQLQDVNVHIQSFPSPLAVHLNYVDVPHPNFIFSETPPFVREAASNEIVAIVHQYDRRDVLVDRFELEYILKPGYSTEPYLRRKNVGY